MRILQIPEVLTIPNILLGWSTISSGHHPDALFSKTESMARKWESHARKM